jgi:outer membrane lipoprotein-sorting protein
MKFRMISLLALALAALPPALSATPASVVEIVERADEALFGSTTVQGEYEMSVITPSWTRTMTMKAWMDRPNKTFVRIVAPAKEAGVTSLAITPEMWNYVPSLERVIKVPPSMMLQSWFGSDFSNDDVMKQGGVLKHYVPRLAGETTVGADAAYEVELSPRPDAPVAYARVVWFVRKSDLLPLREDYYDERGTKVRQMEYSEPQQIGGRLRPTRHEVRSLATPGKRSVLKIKTMVIGQPIDAGIFTLQNLKRRD